MTRPKHTSKFNDIAIEIAKTEGKKQEVNIAQISEVLKITLEIFARDMALWPFETMEFIRKYHDNTIDVPEEEP